MDTRIVSGPGKQLAAMVPQLRDVGIDVRPFVFQNPKREKTPYRLYLEAAGIDYTVINFHKRFDPGLVTAYRKALEEFAPHIVQTHSYRPTVLTWLLRISGATWRWIAFFHGTTNEDFKVRLYHWLDRRLLPKADRLVVVSRNQIDRFGVPSTKVVQLNNAVLLPDANKLSLEVEDLMRRVESMPRPRIGVIGRLSREKGVDVLLEAILRLRNNGF